MGGGQERGEDIEELSLSVREELSLRRNGVHTIAELTSRTETELVGMRGLGSKALESIVRSLKRRGLELSTDSASAEGAMVAEHEQLEIEP